MNARLPEVDPNEAVELVDDGALLLDVREMDEWQAGHAPDARHVPMSTIPRVMRDLPTDVPIVAICRSGRRSAEVTVYMNNAGFDVRNLEGGMQEWSAMGHPVVTDDGSPGMVI
jgi:rhodanese-related sulfurtransferase